MTIEVTDEMQDVLEQLNDCLPPDPLFAEVLEQMEVSIEVAGDGLTEEEKRTNTINDLIEFAEKTLVVIQSWQMPPLDRYTRDLIEGREQLEIDATLLLTSMKTCKDKPEEHFDRNKEFKRSVLIRETFNNLKQLFTNYKERNEQIDSEEDEAKDGSGSSTSKGQKRKGGH